MGQVINFIKNWWKKVQLSLDFVSPFRQCTIHSQHKFCLCTARLSSSFDPWKLPLTSVSFELTSNGCIIVDNTPKRKQCHSKHLQGSYQHGPSNREAFLEQKVQVTESQDGWGWAEPLVHVVQAGPHVHKSPMQLGSRQSHQTVTAKHHKSFLAVSNRRHSFKVLLKRS